MYLIKNVLKHAKIKQKRRILVIQAYRNKTTMFETMLMNSIEIKVVQHCKRITGCF